MKNQENEHKRQVKAQDKEIQRLRADIVEFKKDIAEILKIVDTKSEPIVAKNINKKLSDIEKKNKDISELLESMSESSLDQKIAEKTSEMLTHPEFPSNTLKDEITRAMQRQVKRSVDYMDSKIEDLEERISN